MRRRKDIGVPTQLMLEPALARRSSRRRLETLLVVFLSLCALEGVVIAAATGRWLILPVVTGIGVLYFFCAREWGDAWLRRAMRATTGGRATRMQRLAGSEARSANVPAPDILICPGAEPNAIAFALRKRTVLLTESCEELDELALEGILAHEVIHLRDGDAAVASLFLVLSGAPELLLRGAGWGTLLAIPVWPAALLMRLGRRIAQPEDREHRADIAAAMLTRYPPGIVDALEAAGGRSWGFGLADGFWFVPRNAPDEARRVRAGLVAEM